MTKELFEKLESWTWSSAVFGLGYVGLPLVVTQARAGVKVTGFDIDPVIAEQLARGRSHIDDVTDEDLADVKHNTAFTSNVEDAKSADVLFICVPTPLQVGKLPDVTFIERAAEAISTILRPGQIVILESTTYPGTTEDAVLPILRRTGLDIDKDFLLAYSPERVDPGNASFRTANIPRVVGGVTESSGKAAQLVYRRFVEKVFAVSSARAAEMAKLLENTFRWVNIALANEMASVARAIGVDVYEVIDAAATKPFGFMPFYPGPGVGGHCIPLDPFYLQWAARLTGEGTRFIELAEVINSRMPQVVVSRVQDALNEHSIALRGARVLILGVAYKPNVSDHRESPALEVILGLQRAGANVSYADPHVPQLDEHGVSMRSVQLSDGAVDDADCVVIVCDHDAFDYASIAARAKLIVDTRNALGRRRLKGENVTSL